MVIPKLKKYRLFIIAFTLLIVASAVLIGTQAFINSPATEKIKKTITIGNVYAAGTPDYTCNGVNDDVEFQQALDALPAVGGKLAILAGDYSFGATVSRAIDDVTIEGVGTGVHIAYDNSTPVFSAGTQNNWVFRDFETDNGGVTITSATDWIIENVMVGTTHYAMWNSAGTSYLGGAITLGGNLIFEGSTADDNEITVTVTDPGSDFTITLPAATGEVSLLGQSIDISDETNLVAGSNITLTDDTLSIDSTVTLDSEWNTIGEIETVTGVNIIVSTEIDAETELESLLSDVTQVYTNNDTDFINVDDLADADWGDFSISSGSATLDTGVVGDNEIDYSAVTLDDFDYQTAWRLFYSDGSGDVTELSLGSAGTYLQSQGATSIPTWASPGGSGTITAVGDVASGDSFTADGGGTTLYFEGSSADAWEVILTSADPSGADFTITLPATTGTVVTTGDTGTVTNTMLAGSIDISDKTNLVAGSNISLSDDTLNIDSTVTLDEEWNTIGEIESATSVNIIVSTEIDAESELESLLADVTNVFTNNDTIDISDYTNLAGGTNITLSDDTLNVDDVFLLNSGDTGSGDYDMTSAIFMGASPLVFEGATDDSYNLTFAITDITSSSKTITFPNATGEVSLLGQSIDISDETNLVAGTNISLSGDTLNVDDAFLLNNGDTGTGDYDFTGAIFMGATPIVLEGATDNSYQLNLAVADIASSSKTITFPDATGTVTLGIDWDTIGEIETATSVNILVSTELDAETELESLLADVTQVYTNNDVDYINADDLADADWGDFSISSGSATLDTGVVGDNEIDYSAVTLDDFDYQTAWRLFYSNTDGDVTELAFGAAGTFLKSTGASGVPTWEAPGGGGDITAVGDGSTGDVFTADGTGYTLYFEGSTADDYEVILTSADASGSDFTITLPATTGTVVTTGDTGTVTNTMLAGSIDVSDKINLTAGDHITLTDDDLDVDDDFLLNTGDTGSGDYDFTSAIFLGASPLVFEGATDDAYNLTFAITDITSSSKTITFPNATGEVSLLGQSIDISDETNLTAGDHITLTDDDLDVDDDFLLNTGDTGTGDYDLTGAIFLGATPLILEGSTDDAYQLNLAVTDITGSSKTITFPNATGTVTLGIDWDTIGEIETATSVNILVSTELDAESELEGLLEDVTQVYTNNDTDYINTDDLADADWGDFSISSGSATLDTGVVGDNEIDYSAVTLDDFDYQTAWRLFYSNTDGDVTELALGADGTYLKSNGASSAPTWATPAGGITAVGDGSTGAVFTADGEGTTLYFEGSSADDYEIILTSADPSGSDFTITLPATTGTVITTGDTGTVTNTMLAGSIDISDKTNLVAGTNITLSDDTLNVDDAFLLNNGDMATGDFDFTAAYIMGASPLMFEGNTDDDYQLIVAVTDITDSDKTITFPNITGTVVTTGDTGSVTNTMLAGSIDISDKTNLVAGTNITLSDDTLNVDDAFLLNNGDTASGDYDLTSVILMGASPLVLEGSTDDAYNLTIAVTDITSSSKTLTLQDATGTVVINANAVNDLENTGFSVSAGVLALAISEFGNEASPTSGDKFLMWDGSSHLLVDYDDLPGGIGGVTAVGDVSGANPAFTADGGGTQLWFEGGTADEWEIILTSDDPSGSDFTATLSDHTGYLAVDATEVWDLEGTGLSITTGVLNWTMTADTIDTSHFIHSTDWGDVSTDGSGNVYIDDDVIVIANLADEDWGEIAISSGVAYLSALTQDWSQTGAFDIILANADSQLQIMESSGGTYYATIDAGDLSADRTLTIPDAAGYVVLCSEVLTDFEGSGDFEVDSNQLSLADTNYFVILTAGGATTDSSNAPDQSKIDGTNHDYYSCDFDPDTDEIIYWDFTVPDSYTGGNITPEIYWTSTATSGAAVWSVQVLGVTDSETWDASLGSAQSATTTTDGTAGDINTTTITAFSPSWSAGDLVIVKLYRDADNGSDTMTTDARLLQVKITWPSSR